jgi:inosine/xanthosine triphosphate pyrophosphatase family protein
MFSRFTALHQLYPIVIEDTMLFLEHFNSFYPQNRVLPGPDTKRWWLALKDKGVIQLMRDSKRRSATYVAQTGISNAPGHYEILRFELNGRISNEVRSNNNTNIGFPFINNTYFHSIFIPEGSNNTLAEMEAIEFSQYDYRRQCLLLALPKIVTSSGRKNK